MTSLRAEIEHNFGKFFETLPGDINRVLSSLSKEKERYHESYERIVSFQAWRGGLVDSICATSAVDFFKEAQNDALMSHSLARQGSWRVALMCLRSCIENTLFGLYYLDHPVELAQWENGQHYLGFTEVIAYISRHPSLSGVNESITGLDVIRTEYATLSKAVHGSTTRFRMTKTGAVEGLNIDSLADLGAWSTRERQTAIGLNLIMTAFFHAHLGGAAHQNLRKLLGMIIPVGKHAEIRKHFGVLVRAPKKVEE